MTPASARNRSQTRAAVDERDQLRVVGSADRLETSPDQHGDVGIGPHDSAEYLPASVGRLDVADANLAWGDDCQPFSCLWHATATPIVSVQRRWCHFFSSPPNPHRISKCRSPSWQLRMKVESKVMVTADVAAAG